MSFIITVQPTVEPITLAEAKMHLRIDGTFEDSILLDYIRAARSHVERFTGVSYTVQTIKAVIKRDENQMTDWFKKIEPLSFELPLSPVNEILTAEDKDGPIEYESDLVSIPATITPANAPDEIVVTYTTNTSAMAPEVKIGMLMILHQIYESRGMVESESVMRVEEAYLRQHRVRLGMA